MSLNSLSYICIPSTENSKLITQLEEKIWKNLENNSKSSQKKDDWPNYQQIGMQQGQYQNFCTTWRQEARKARREKKVGVEKKLGQKKPVRRYVISLYSLGLEKQKMFKSQTKTNKTQSSRQRRIQILLESRQEQEKVLGVGEKNKVGLS